MLFEPQGRVGAGELPEHQRLLLFPGVGNEVDVLQVPGVIVRPDARRTGLGIRLAFEPFTELVGGLASRHDALLELVALAGHLTGKILQIGALSFHGADPHHPEIPGVSDQIGSGLLEKRRDGHDPCCELRSIRLGKRILVGPQVDPSVDDRTLVSRDVALSRKDLRIESRILHPGFPHAVIEIEAVHLGSYQMVVHLLRHRPAARVDRDEPLLVPGQLAVLGCHGLRGVVRNAIDKLGLLELSPLLEQRDEIIVAGTRGGSTRRLFARSAAGAAASSESEHCGQTEKRLPSERARHGRPPLSPASHRNTTRRYSFSTRRMSNGKAKRANPHGVKMPDCCTGLLPGVQSNADIGTRRYVGAIRRDTRSGRYRRVERCR